MKVVIFGGAGMLGSAIAHELRSHGHSVVTAGRSGCDVQVDFLDARRVEEFAPIIEGADVVINAVGILMERGDERFDAVHVTAPQALFEACAKAHVARVVQISALGAGRAQPISGRYMASKRAAEAALTKAMASSRGDAVIVRPGLLMDAASPATKLFMQLARLPIIALPGLFSGLLHTGSAMLSPMLCSDAAGAICRICEHPKALHRAIEIAGPEELSYREFLAQLRSAQGLKAAIWLPMPWALMRLVAKLAEFVPQKVISENGMRVLQAGITTERNEALYWLRCMPKPAVADVFIAQSAIRSAVST